MNKKFTGIITLLIISIHSGQIYGGVDQSQLDYEYTADLASDGGSGQTFTAGIVGDIIGIRLLVEGASWGPSYKFGSDVQISLRRILGNNIVSDSILAKGYISANSIKRDIPTWVEVIFDRPYHQNIGQKLAFTIKGLSGGGANGWNDYGMSSSNPYAEGTQFYYYDNNGIQTSNTDMAFETIVVVPEPATIMFLTLGAFFLKRKVIS